MRDQRLRKSWLAVVAALVAVAAAASLYAAWSGPEAQAVRSSTEVLRFDVAEDPTRFVFAPTPVDADGLPAYGNYFITQGYLYPEGTLNGSDGVLPDGRPEFPDKVLGEWTCWGSHVGEGAKTKTGPIVVTTQLYRLGDRAGDRTVVTEGYELADVGVPVKRAITGGTGRFRSAGGEQVQRLLGFGASNGVKLRVTLRIDGGRE
ncbi:MAG: hypothetical protein ACRDUY_11005 [Nitriliruptorales bacterium]